MKKIISSLVLLSLFCSMINPVYAQSIEETTDTEGSEIIEEPVEEVKSEEETLDENEVKEEIQEETIEEEIVEEEEEVVEPTSFAHKLFETLEEYLDELNNQMSRVYDLLNGHVQEENTCPIPGVIVTSYDEEESTKSSAYYTPQGLCLAGDYMLVTAYHNPKVNGEMMESNKGWSAVLYVIDASTHEFITTISLPQSYHNGGIAYDGENVWFCGNTGKTYLADNQPFVQCMKFSRLQEIVNECGQSGEILEEDVSEKMYIDNASSFLECDNGILWVGTYLNNDQNSNEGYAIGYPIQDMDGESPSLNKLNVYRINGMPSSSQGMDIDGLYLYVSSSGHGNQNWVESSFISKFDMSELENSHIIDLQGIYETRVEVPKMNEEIIVTEETVYMIFESTSEAYLTGMPNGMKTDRILAVDKELWEVVYEEEVVD